MSQPNVIVVKGADGEPPGTPVDGKPASPLVDGNGDPGKASTSGKACVTRATNGHPGNTGGGAPVALKGGNGLNAPAVRLTVTRITAASPFTVTVTGGDGGKGNSGGKGGAGGDGGDAGLQPAACAKKYGDTTGGPGGMGGDGGQAGDGGDAGSGGVASLLWDDSLADFNPQLTSTAGEVGDPGDPGGPGTPGDAGLNGDGKTRGGPAPPASPGGIGQFGRQGHPGTGTTTPVTKPQYQVRLVVVPL